MKVAIISDVHIDEYTHYNKDSSRLDNCLNAVEDVFNYCYENNIKNIFCTGDFFNRMNVLSVVVQNKTLDTFNNLKQLGIKFYYITGNHDHAFANIPMVHAMQFLDDAYKWVKSLDADFKVIGNDVFCGIPFYRYGKFFKSTLNNLIDNLYSASLEMPEYNWYLLMHQYPTGLKNKYVKPEINQEDILGQLENFEFIFCGHDHQHQLISNDFMIVGSLLPNSHMDNPKDDKGFIVFNTEDNSYERVILDYPKFLTVRKIKDTIKDFQRIKEKKKLVIRDKFEIGLTPEELIVKYWEKNSDDKELLKTGKSLLG